MGETNKDQEKKVIQKIFDTYHAEGKLNLLTMQNLRKEMRRHLGHKPLLTKAEIKEFLPNIMSKYAESESPTENPLSPERLEVDGELYKLGDVVDVGYGPYLHVAGAGGREKKKTELWEIGQDRILETEVDVDPDVGDMIERDPDEDDDDEPDYADEGVDPFPIFPPSPDPSDPLSSPSPIKEGKWRTESGIDYTYKRVDHFTGAALQLAKQFGLDVKDLRMVPVPYKRRVRDAELRYRGYDKFEVVRGPGGKLTLRPYRPYLGQIELLEKDYLPPPIPKGYKPTKVKIPQPPPEYTGKLRFGHCVKFVVSHASHIEGAVLRAGNENFDVVTIFGQRIDNISYFQVTNMKVDELPSTMQGSKKNQIVIIPSPIEGEEPRKYIFNVQSDVRPPKRIALAYKIAPPPNKFVKFTRTALQELEGHILGFQPKGFVIGGADIRGTIIIPYDHPTLKKIECPKKRRPVVVSKATVEDMLAKPVEQSTRSQVVRRLFDLLGELIPNVYATPVENDMELQAIGSKVNWDLISRGLISWESYYADEFRKWMYARYITHIRKRCPDFTTAAAEEAIRRVDPVLLIEQLTGIFGEDMFNGDGVDLVRRMENIVKEGKDVQGRPVKPTILDIHLRQKFAMIGHEGLLSIKGEKLAQFAARFIAGYLRNYPPDPSGIAEQMRQEWISTEFNRIVPSPDERLQFENEHLGVLKNFYEKWKQEYAEAKKGAEAWDLKRKEILDRRDILRSEQRKIAGKLDGKELTREGITLYRNIANLEEKLYLLTDEGKTNFLYLRKFCEIALFLDPKSNLGKYSKFFRSKIASGMYPVEHLDSATLYHAFPEFFINEKLSDSAYEVGLKMLGQEIYDTMLEYIRSWILRETTVYKRIRQAESKRDNKVWHSYVTELEGCGTRILANAKMSSGDIDIDAYDCSSIGFDPDRNDTMFRCIAKREAIPPEDLILCYSDEKFVCLSLNDILYALAERERDKTIPVNPITGIPYTKEFLDRMKHRYGDMLIGNLEKYPKRITELTVPSGVIYFGESPEKTPPLKKKIPVKTPSPPKTPETLEDALENVDDLLVLYFYHLWDPAHKRAKKTLDTIKEQSNVKLIQIDIDKDGDKLFKNLGLKKKLPMFVAYDLLGVKLGELVFKKDAKAFLNLLI